MMSHEYLTQGLLWLVTTTALYCLMNGAQIFETALIVLAKAMRWRNLNYLRVAIFMAVNMALLSLIFRVAGMLANIGRPGLAP